MERARKRNQVVGPIDLEDRSPRWLDIATITSILLGAAEMVVGVIGRSNAVLSNAIENLDNATYGLDAVAARHESNRKRNHRLRRWAGAVICAASMTVMANSAEDLVTHQPAELSTVDIIFASASMALDAAYVMGLRPYAQRGTTHRDACRHATADTLSSGVAVAAIAASMNGYPAVDALSGLALGAWTIAMTFPTHRRITAADNVFAGGDQEVIELGQDLNGRGIVS